MAQIKCYDKRVGITYVYESESYYDKEKHQSRSKRKLIGKIDPDTGEVIPTGKKGRPSKNPVVSTDENEDYRKLYEKALSDSAKKDARIDSLEKELRETRNELQDYRRAVQKISDICASQS